MELKIKERKKINILSYELCRTKRKDRRMERTKRTEKRERGENVHLKFCQEKKGRKEERENTLKQRAREEMRDKRTKENKD